ncbi:hypothetical protein DOTSEDRAFT_53535 [Dothistroma septosporum NZE10]|uniref:Carboxylic ester hydrolase n=1 Tax=Dothistroma septosporum (strain NZE10 / CBS 128990) TaxID=675120 RepID=N1PND6_DOTSN|nr:hypothetical protein DOTSEDRAFT_53535 [Dothistroma septosporum NZE10]
MHLLALLACAATVAAVDPLVQLKYTSYKGTALPNGVTQWLGIRYAKPPLGELRFARPQDPEINEGVQAADQHGHICLPTKGGPPSTIQDEDCLFLDVYAPTNATLGEAPVFFFVQGGGFNTNSNANYNGSGLILAAEMDAVVITFNYRVGPYGFLAGKEIADSNNGLLDQRKALEWVQQYINLFGGNSSHVILAGDSAGAQAVTLHLTAYGGRNDNLFHATAAESQSFSALRTVEESQFAYNNLVVRAECYTSADTLACLRNLTATQLQAININTPFPGAQNPPLYMYGPVLDYDFITDYTYRAYAEGKFVHVPAIYGDDTNEGTVFVPNTTASYAETSIFLQSQFPDLTLAQLDHIQTLYPVDRTPSFPDTGRFWRQASDAYGEMRYICPGINVSATYAARGVPVWNYRWNVIDPPSNADGHGVQHTVEVHAIFGPNNTQGGAPASYYAGQVNGPVVAVVQGYWASFIRSFNPNTYRVEGTPEWEEFETMDRLKFETGSTAMEAVSEDQKHRCGYLAGIGVSVKQ